MARIASCTKAQCEKPAFTINSQAQHTLHKIEEQLMCLEQMGTASPLDSQFSKGYAEVLENVDHYHTTVIHSSEYSVACSSGCAACCCHWVEDVNSFEGILIAAYIKRVYPGEVARIKRQCQADCKELLRLEDLVTEKLAEQHEILKELPDAPDGMDLLLSVFYQMQRPCPLLSAEGICMVYPVRPLTCRMYVSVSDPVRCDPEYINESVIPTCIIDVSPKVNALLDTLHSRYAHGEGGDTGLRSLLIHHLC